MTLLEARAMRLPIVVRSIPSLNSLGYPAGNISAADVAAEVQRALSDPERYVLPRQEVNPVGRRLEEGYLRLLAPDQHSVLPRE